MISAKESLIPPASGSTILGITILIFAGVSALLHHFGYSSEAALVIAGGWAIVHPQVNRSIPVAEAPPNQTLPEALN